MAKWHALLFVGGLLSQLALVGCQPTSPPVASLPAPSFDAPKLAAVQPLAPIQPSQPTSTFPRIAKGPNATPPRIASSGAIPLGWVPPVTPRDWTCIVVHHSATTTGGAAAFDKMHRAKGWDELGYDFVVGNGTDTADGQIEVGSRWTKQKIGAHAKTPDNYYNEHGIGICLVGNFDVERPTPAQVRSLTRLVAYLMHTYHIKPDRVMGHKETGKPTDCPGRYMNVASVGRQAAQMAGMDSIDDRRQASASTELLIDNSK